MWQHDRHYSPQGDQPELRNLSRLSKLGGPSHKSVLGFRQFLLRGLDKVRGEWNLVTLAWNLKRMFVLSPAG